MRCLLTLVTAGVSAATPATLAVEWLRHADAVCNDGSRGGFYFRAATEAAQKKKWLVYLPPHHWCNDKATCAERHATDIDMMSSTQWATNVTVDGIFAAGPLAGANLVQVGYCSSDIYLGDVAASDATWGWHFRGERIVRSTFEQLVSDFGLGAGFGHSVVLGGASAGARGATVWLDRLKELVPRGVRRFGFLDTPHPFHHFEAFLPSGPTPDYTPENTQDIVDMLRPGIEKFLIPEACPERSDHWKCLYAEFRLPHVAEDYVLVAPRFGHEIESDLGVTSVANLSAAQLEYAEAWGDAVRRVVSELADNSLLGKRVLYSPSCFQPHVQSAKANFYAGGQGVNGMSQQGALEMLFNDDAEDVQVYGDNCTTFNCGPKCDPIVSVGAALV